MAKVVTITNPVTGQPAQVDQLDHTAQQIDDAVEAARWSHRNLLDNAYWANPDAIIDQRGGYVVPPDTPYYSDTGLTSQAGTVSAYTKAAKVNSTYGTIIVSGTTYYVKWSAAVRGYVGAGYGIDRWFAASPGTVVTVQSGYVRIAPPASNYFGWMNYFEADSLLGQTVTFSALCRYTGSGGAILPYITAYIGDNQYDSSAQINQTTWQCISFTITFPTDKPSDGRFGFDVVAMQNFGVDIKAAKLELGSQQTLAHQENGVWVLNEIPDYGEQLARCQRYHFEFGPSHALIAYDGYGVNSPVVYFPVQMRTVSAIKVYSKAGAENAITYWNGSAEVDFTDFSLEWNENFVTLRSNNGAFVPGGIYTIGKLIAYADL